MNDQSQPCTCSEIYHSIERGCLDCFKQFFAEEYPYRRSYNEVYLYQAICYHAETIYWYLYTFCSCPEIARVSYEALNSLFIREQFDQSQRSYHYPFYARIMASDLMINYINHYQNTNNYQHSFKIYYPNNPHFYFCLTQCLTATQLVIYHQYCPFPKEYRWCLANRFIETMDRHSFQLLYTSLELGNYTELNRTDLTPLLFIKQDTFDFMIEHVPFDLMVGVMHLHLAAGLQIFYNHFHYLRQRCKNMANFADDILFMTMDLIPKRIQA